MQTSITVANGAITGTLKYIEGGLSPAGPLSGSGYFLALKWSDPAQTVTSLKVGLIPSASGMDLVECIDDTDRNGVFKITDKDTQKLVIIESQEGRSRTQQYKLNGLTLESTGV